MKDFSRRDFLKGSLAGAAALTLTGLGLGNTTAEATSDVAAPADSKPSFFTNPYQHSAADAVKTVTAEVVIVGAGNAGCAAAAAIADAGVQAVVLEAQNTIHGQGGGIGMVNTKFVQSLVDEGKLDALTDVEQHQSIWIQRCGSRVNEKLVSMWFNNAPATGEWLIDKCAEYGVIPISFRAHAPKAYVPETYDYHMFFGVAGYEFDERCGYFAASNVCYTDARRADKHDKPATFFFQTKAQDLLVEDGRVVGVFAERDGELWLFRATRGVILATGGIHEDPEMVAYYCDDYVNRVQRCEHGPVGFSTGDGHKMGLWVGAKMQEGGPFPLMLHPQANAMFHGCFPFVNLEGERFMNEGTWVQGKSMNIMNQTGNIAYSIFDKNWAEYNRKSLEGGTGGGMFWDSMGGGIGVPFADEDLVPTVESDVANGNTLVADTLEELAEKIGCPKDVFLATMARYNEEVKAGRDEDFHKPVEMLYPVEEGPFYAAKIGVALLAIVGGLSVNTDLQVLNTEKHPIPGLYATGNTSGDLYAIDYPINCAGNSNGRCFIWGYRLGQIMAAAESTGEAVDSCEELAALAGLESTVKVDDTVYKDGQYKGSGQGRNGPIDVTVTITDGKISAVSVDSHSESADMGALAMDKLINQAVAGNTANIDGASGVTMTSNGFREAVAAALAQAK